MASRRVTIAPPDGSGGGASPPAAATTASARCHDHVQWRDPSLRKTREAAADVVQTGGFSAPKAPAIPAKERLAKLMVVSPRCSAS